MQKNPQQQPNKNTETKGSKPKAGCSIFCKSTGFSSIRQNKLSNNYFSLNHACRFV
jgi:hypothetical protein